ncbi:MAG: DUF3568 family protein [Granulosicoccaceae bacterium]|jgi:hypothetical protein
MNVLKFSQYKKNRHTPALLVLLASLGLSGCDPVSLTLFGIGASTGVSYGLNSVAYKTFTAPMNNVSMASTKALKDMGIKVKAIEKSPDKQVIKAASNEHEIELTLEAVSSKTTRIRSVARQGPIFLDRATATEIIIQTERVLVNQTGKVLVGA